MEAEILRRQRNKIAGYFPDTGPRRRELYAKHIEFFDAGAIYKERLFMAANRIGKSQAGAFETACHLTGIYPKWWKGRRFAEAGEWWACGTNAETTRNIVQSELLGKVDAPGTGFIPGDLIVHTALRRSGAEGSIESAWIRHVTGKTALLGLKTYEQGRQSFEGTAKQGMWWDEEPPLDVYVEGLYRTVTTRGIVLTTFTPLQGMSEVVKTFLEPENEESRSYKWYVQAGWKDVPHIDEEEQRILIATTPPYQIQARTEGEPSLGAGAIYPIAEAEITVADFPIPDHWPRAFGMDVGWQRTAAIFGARDPSSGIIYLYSEHYVGQSEPASHAQAIKARGDWIPGVIDPACLGSSQIDGRSLMEMYTDLGLNLSAAKNAVEAGLSEVWQLMVGGRLKVFASCQNWFREFRKYHRDDKGSGKIVKRDDHLLDGTRYLVVSGRDVMATKPTAARTDRSSYYDDGNADL
jgi:phage terminase large subunit-like protein